MLAANINEQKLMTRNNFHLRFFLLLSLLATACVDEIDLPVSAADLEKLVIQGTLRYGNPSRLAVQLSRTANFRASAVPEAVDGASVTLADEEGQQFTLAAAGKGDYRLDLGAGVVIGRSYQLRVRLPDGSAYESSWEPVLPAPSPERVSFGVVTRQELNAVGNIVDQLYVQFFITTPLRAPGADDKSYLKWDFEGVFIYPETPPPPGPAPWPRCYVTQRLNLDEITLFEGPQASGDQLDSHFLFEEKIDHRFHLGFYLTTYQQAISPGAFTYFDQVNTVISRNGGLFDLPPGPIRSNLRRVDGPEEEVLGYFYAVTTDTLRERIDIPFELRPTYQCDPLIAESTNVLCDDCLRWPVSTLERPDYWEE